MQDLAEGWDAPGTVTIDLSIFGRKAVETYGKRYIALPKGYDIVGFKLPVVGELYVSLRNTVFECYSAQAAGKVLVIKKTAPPAPPPPLFPETLPYGATALVTIEKVYDYENREVPEIPPGYVYDGFRVPKKGEHYLTTTTREAYFCSTDGHVTPRAILKPCKNDR